jgi:hypothetical protein
MWYYEKATVTGWMPHVSPERPRQKAGESMVRLRLIHEVPESMRKCSLSEIQAHIREVAGLTGTSPELVMVLKRGDEIEVEATTDPKDGKVVRHFRKAKVLATSPHLCVELEDGEAIRLHSNIFVRRPGSMTAVLCEAWATDPDFGPPGGWA